MSRSGAAPLWKPYPASLGSTEPARVTECSLGAATSNRGGRKHRLRASGERRAPSQSFVPRWWVGCSPRSPPFFRLMVDSCRRRGIGSSFGQRPASLDSLRSRRKAPRRLVKPGGWQVGDSTDPLVIVPRPTRGSAVKRRSAAKHGLMAVGAFDSGTAP